MKLEVFFDYVCPFCMRGHKNLIELIPDFPQLEIIWRPCESHPRPESYGMHSDLCIQGMYFAMDQDVDLWAYHERAFSLMSEKHVNVENIDILAQSFSDLLDSEAFRDALQKGKYRDVQQSSNDYAYQHSGVWAVPSYRMNGRKLDAVEGVGVTKEQLRVFLEDKQASEDIIGRDIFAR